MNDKGVARAQRLDTATLSDALDRLGLVGQCYKIKPRSISNRMTGRAWTLQYGPAGNPPGTVGDYIDDIEPGAVIVLANGGGDDVTVWGDILTEVAHRNGIAGTAIDGINRDVALAPESACVRRGKYTAITNSRRGSELTNWCEPRRADA